MRIVIPSEGETLESEVCPSFGRAPYFIVYDTKTQTWEGMVNVAVESSGGAGIKAAQAVVDSGAATLLTPKCGENAAKVLKAAGINIFSTVPGSVEENVKEHSKGNLLPLEKFHAGFHGHGSN